MNIDPNAVPAAAAAAAVRAFVIDNGDRNFPIEILRSETSLFASYFTYDGSE